jgi:F-type H+-transporting ATPase subunit gamma
MAVESLKTLRRRLRSVKSIGKITRAMEMVAASKLRRAQSTLLAGRPYAAKLQELLAHLAGSSALGEHPLFKEREEHSKVLVIFTSDRGLSGSFNANIIKMAEEILRAEPETAWQLVCVGRKGRDYFLKRKWPVIESIVGLGGHPDLPEAQRIAAKLQDLFLAGECDSVWLLYSAFISTMVSQPTVARYLPMTPESLGLAPPGQFERHHGEVVDYILEPSAGEVFNELLPRFLSSRIYITMAEVATSEHSARMIAMNNATKNCTEMSDQLTLRLNKARQGAITKELLEIVGGAEALKGGAA